MTIYSEKLDIPGGLEISEEFIKKFKKFYESIKGNHPRLRIYFRALDGSSLEFNSFEDCLAATLPKNTELININFYKNEGESSYISVDFRLNKEKLFTDCQVKGASVEAVIKMKRDIMFILEDFETNFSWLYKCKNLAFWVISFLFSSSIIYLVYGLINGASRFAKSSDYIPFLVLFYFIFVSISSGILSWLYPRVSFTIRREQSRNMKKWWRYVLGALALGLITNLLYELVKTLF